MRRLSSSKLPGKLSWAASPRSGLCCASGARLVCARSLMEARMGTSGHVDDGMLGTSTQRRHCLHMAIHARPIEPTSEERQRQQTGIRTQTTSERRQLIHDKTKMRAWALGGQCRARCFSKKASQRRNMSFHTSGLYCLPAPGIPSACISVTVAVHTCRSSPIMQHPPVCKVIMLQATHRSQYFDVAPRNFLTASASGSGMQHVPRHTALAQWLGMGLSQCGPARL